MAQEFNVNRLASNVKDMLVGDEDFPIERARKLVDKNREESCINFLSRQDITSEDLENFVDSPFKEVRKIIAAHDKTISYDVIKKLLADESDEVVITVITESEAVKNDPLVLFEDEIILNKEFLKYASYDVLLSIALCAVINYNSVYRLFDNIKQYKALEEDKLEKFSLDFYIKLLRNYYISETDLIEILDWFVKDNNWDDEYNESHPLVKIFREILIYRYDLQTPIQNEFINADRIHIWKYAPINFTRSLDKKSYNALDKCINDNLCYMDDRWQIQDYIGFFSEFFSSRFIKTSTVERFIKYYFGYDYKKYAEEVTSMFKILCNNEYLTEEIIYFIYRELKHLVKHDVITDIKGIYACLYYNNNCSKRLKEVLKDNM